MPRVACGKCSRELDYGDGDRPMFCAYCGQSLGTLMPRSSDTATILEPTRPEGRGDETVDFVSRPGAIARSEVPDRVKGYRLIRQLGRGGMGTVYEAEDSRHGRKVAIKIIAPGYVDSGGAVERFRQEGRLASSLAHPRCVFVIEADEDDDGRPFIAMELMTGDTLQDLVDKGGPLGIGDAVAKILDVIDGLREAHRLGLIHRDVKPSNCFLEGDGRVKVGDFGLSKSQVDSKSHLTRTGAFLGTPLYASPEQIKVDVLDERTDVYSTAATLFFLLTGRAPFDRGDASATMARIVTDPPPSAREKRPEVPAGLDRAIRKALETDRDRRTRDLGAFREALQPFLPGNAPATNPALRVAVYVMDYALTYVILAGLLYYVEAPLALLAINLSFLLAYFSVFDGLLGGSPAKRLMRMRVVDAGSLQPIGFGRAVLRTASFLGLAELPISIDLFNPGFWPGRPGLWHGLCLGLEVAGLAVLAWPILARRDYRGLHDAIARTRVVGRPRDDRRRSAESRRPIGRDRGSVSRPVGVMQAVGPYKIRGAIRWEATRRVVAGEDSSLGREAWIVIRAKGSPPPEPARREVARATRPRWLAGGDQAEGHWDAYVAPNGCPLADFAGPDGLPWRDARMILQDMADELATACLDGTVPPGLTVDQVWVQPDGRAILIDALGIVEPSPATQESPEPSDDERALSLLRRVAALALEGGRCRADAIPKAIRSPMPVHASALLARLLGGAEGFRDVESFRLGLDATRHLPTEVSRAHRATNLVFLTLALALGLICTFYVINDVLSGDYDPKSIDGPPLDPAYVARARLDWAVFYACFFPTIWIVWDFLTRGGFALRLSGLALVLGDGRPAPRWRCAWRSFVTWAPMAGLLVASVWASGVSPQLIELFYYAALALPAIDAALAIAFPSRGPHDWLSGLRVVPR